MTGGLAAAPGRPSSFLSASSPTSITAAPSCNIVANKKRQRVNSSANEDSNQRRRTVQPAHRHVYAAPDKHREQEAEDGWPKAPQRSTPHEIGGV
jgi:hypothetical protein